MSLGGNLHCFSGMRGASGAGFQLLFHLAMAFNAGPGPHLLRRSPISLSTTWISPFSWNWKLRGGASQCPEA